MTDRDSIWLKFTLRNSSHSNRFSWHQYFRLHAIANCKQGAQLSPSDPRDALYQLKCCSSVPLLYEAYIPRERIWINSKGKNGI